MTLAALDERIPAPERTEELPLLVLEPGRADRRYWHDLWAYRELFAILAWRDVAVQYKQSVVGIAWAVVRPLLTVAVFTVVFGRLAAMPSDGSAPYALMVMAGTLPWLLFATVLSGGAQSLVVNANLVSRVWFPRIVVPAASAAVALVDFAVGVALLLVMMAFLGVPPDWRVLTLPLFAALAVVAAFGPALVLAALNVRYRDVRFVVPFVVQFGLYLSPVGFSSEVVPERWRLVYALNPAVAAIDGVRWATLGGEARLYLPGLAVGVAVALVLLVVGVRVFRAAERSFADVV